MNSKGGRKGDIKSIITNSVVLDAMFSECSVAIYSKPTNILYDKGEASRDRHMRGLVVGVAFSECGVPTHHNNQPC